MNRNLIRKESQCHDIGSLFFILRNSIMGYGRITGDKEYTLSAKNEIPLTL
ncbi:hypothetical protein RKD55_004676 [Rossellomorea marisflavi]